MSELIKLLRNQTRAATSYRFDTADGWNYCQIVRTPFDKLADRDFQLREHEASMEWMVLFGQRYLRSREFGIIPRCDKCGRDCACAFTTRETAGFQTFSGGLTFFLKRVYVKSFDEATPKDVEELARQAMRWGRSGTEAGSGHGKVVVAAPGVLHTPLIQGLMGLSQIPAQALAEKDAASGKRQAFVLDPTHLYYFHYRGRDTTLLERGGDDASEWFTDFGLGLDNPGAHMWLQEE